jgi:energy-converting hydrogenase Eha subunit A
MLEALFELTVRFLVEFVFYTVLYGLGWVMLKAITLGRYPPPRPHEHSHELVALFPIAVLFVGLTFAFS